MKTMIPNHFTVRHGHFIVEGRDGSVDILINSDPETGAANGLIGEMHTKEDLMERIDEIMGELKEIRESVYYSGYHEESCWNMLRNREPVVTEVA